MVFTSPSPVSRGARDQPRQFRFEGWLQTGEDDAKAKSNEVAAYRSNARLLPEEETYSPRVRERGAPCSVRDVLTQNIS